MTDKYTKRTEGFTLVELSIVIIIIGFLIAGIAAGNSLIKNAQTSHDINVLQSTNMAIGIFIDKYGSLPGDYNNPGNIIPGAGAGDNNGSIFCSWFGNECWIAVQQLALAGLINGSYNGYDQGIPISSKGILLVEQVAPGSLPGYYTFTAHTTLLREWSNVSTAEAIAIDNKIDDGVPSSGNITAIQASPYILSNFCVKESDGVTDADYTTYTGKAQYDFANPDKLCSLAITVSQP